jgi:hypothetical protein
MMKRMQGRKWFADFAVCCIAVALIFTLYSEPVLLSVLLSLCSLFALRFWYTRREVCSFIAGAVTGTASEAILVQSGAWVYSGSVFIGIPLWLPLAWGVVSVLIVRFPGLLSRNV